MIHFSCFFSPVGCVERTLGHAVIGGVFSQLTNWILGSVQWFLDAAGHVLDFDERAVDDHPIGVDRVRRPTHRLHRVC
jgi:hypothetical protein